MRRSPQPKTCHTRMPCLCSRLLRRGPLASCCKRRRIIAGQAPAWRGAHPPRLLFGRHSCSACFSRGCCDARGIQKLALAEPGRYTARALVHDPVDIRYEFAVNTGGTFGNRTDTHAVSGSYRYVRVYATARSAGNNWGYSIFELKVFAQNAAASSSSASSTPTPALLTPVSANASTALTAASNAIDKDGGTRWESAHAIDPSWISFDLGAAKTLTQIAIDWEAGNAAAYTVQGSNDNANWTTIASRTGGTFGDRTDTLALSGNYRYLRIHGTERSVGNQWGYSIWEVRLTGF